MKLVSKKEPVKSVAPYVWGAKYLVLDSVPEHKGVKAGETVVAMRGYIVGEFEVFTKEARDYINPEDLQLIDAVPQVEHVPAPYIDGAEYLVLNNKSRFKIIREGEVVTVYDPDCDGGFSIFTKHAWDHIDPKYLQLIDQAPKPEQTSETVYTLELTESELQGIVTAVEQSFEYERVFSARFTDSKVNVSDAASKVYDEILNLLKENKS